MPLIVASIRGGRGCCCFYSGISELNIVAKVVMHLLQLPDDVILAICGYLSPSSLGLLATTCTHMYRISKQERLWKDYCALRWHHLMEPADSASQGTVQSPGHARIDSWKYYYTSDGGFRSAEFRSDRLLSSSQEHHYVSAVALFTAAEASAVAKPEEDVVLIASCKGVEAWIAGSARDPSQLPRSLAVVPEHDVWSFAPLGNNRAVAGVSDGSLCFFDLSAFSATESHTINECSLLLAESWSPVTELRPSRSGSRVTCLQDSLMDMPGGPSQRNILCHVDVDAQVELGATSDFLENYELLTFGLAQPARGDIVFAAAAHRGSCFKCFEKGLPSLCYHKSSAHCAAICVFDNRTTPNAVQRHGIHHRSIYPKMEVVREHFIFTSHSGTPLAVWDIRRMSGAVYEEEGLGNNPSHGEGLSFPLPQGPARHQGLYLATDGEHLLGRAQNGFLWTWDLSRTLGWQSNGLQSVPPLSLASLCGAAPDVGKECDIERTSGPATILSSSDAVASVAREPACWFARGEGVGTWLCCDDEWQQDGDVARHGCWPRPLGALHTSESTLPVTCLRETSIGTRLLVVMGTATGEDPGRFNCEDFVQLNTFI